MRTAENLFDAVVDAAARWKRKGPSFAAMHRYAQLVRIAERFTVSDEMVRTALDVGTVDNLKRWVNLARLPFPITWVEFDLRAKVRHSLSKGTLRLPDQHDEKNIGSRMGFLMQTLDEESGLWAMTVFILHDEVGAAPQEVCYFLAPEGPSLQLAKLPPPWSSAELDPNYCQISLGVSPAVDRQVVVDRNEFVAFPEFQNRVQVGWEPTWSEILKGSKDRREKVIYRLLEDAGLMRFAIIFLALLNAAPTVKEHHAAPGGHRFRGGKFVPYMDHSVITVKLPKGGVRAVIDRIDVASADRRRNRAHRVRGHFRQVERGRKTIVPCKHEPTLVENGLGICLRCERLIRWIPNHQRGDASVGWVTHDYEVESSREKEKGHGI